MLMLCSPGGRPRGRLLATPSFDADANGKRLPKDHPLREHFATNHVKDFDKAENSLFPVRTTVHALRFRARLVPLPPNHSPSLTLERRPRASLPINGIHFSFPFSTNHILILECRAWFYPV